MEMEKGILSIICFAMFILGLLSGIIMSGTGRNDVLRRNVLDDICEEIYGENTAYISTYFVVEDSFNCKMKESIKVLEPKTIINLIK